MNSPQTQKFTQSFEKTDLPEIRVGDTIKLHQKIKEGDKERIQVFEGLVIAKKHGQGVTGSITVRKIIDGVGVEKMVPLHSPKIIKYEIVAHGKARRAKLYYLRDRVGKKAKLKRKELDRTQVPKAPQTVEETPKQEEVEAKK